METQLQYKLDVFEGPLDLLLTLISKNKIDIYDIQIAQLLDQYLEEMSQPWEGAHRQAAFVMAFLALASGICLLVARRMRDR